jgi:hypothetical protein
LVSLVFKNPVWRTSVSNALTLFLYRAIICTFVAFSLFLFLYCFSNDLMRVNLVPTTHGAFHHYPTRQTSRYSAAADILIGSYPQFSAQ